MQFSENRPRECKILSKIFAYAEVLGWGKAHDKQGNSVQRDLVQLLLKFNQIGL